MNYKTILLASALVALPSLVQAQARPAPPIRPTAPVNEPEADPETVIVTAQRSKNSVQGDAVPETTLAPADIRALGASNVAEILASLGTRVGTGRGRGGGFPIVLLNGRRVSGFAEVRDLPSEAILRVEVFPEATALQYGYAADQRVVNFILRPRFRATTLEGSFGLGAGLDRSEQNAKVNYLRITDKGRLSGNLELGSSNAVTEAQSGVVRSTGFADSAFRTVLPQTTSRTGSLTYTRGLGGTLGATFDVRIGTTDFESLLGLRALGSSDRALRRTSQTTTGRLAATLDGATKGWQWTASTAYDTSETDTETQIPIGPLQTANSENRVFEFVGNGNGTLFKLPAGNVRGSLRAGYLDRQLDSVSVRGGIVSTGQLSRRDTTTRVTISIPITSRRGNFGAAFGDFSLSSNASFTELSDFGALESTGFGLTWAPIADLRFSANMDSAQSAPTIQQLGNPVISTPGSTVFDYTSGQTVLVTRTSGGNSGLSGESRNDVNIGVSFAPTKFEGIEFNASWARNKSDNPVGSLSGLTPDLEAAFGGRFTRVNGALVSIDQRAVNFAESQNEIVRYGVSYSRSFGMSVAEMIAAARARGIVIAGPGTERPQGGPPRGAGDGSRGGTPNSPSASGGGGPPGGFGAFGGFGGGRGGGGGPPTGPTGRWSISLFHTIRLEDSIVLRTGGKALDLLNGAAIDDGGGARRHLVEIEGGWAYFGVGFRANGSWRSGTTVDNGQSDLVFDDIFNLNLRAFASFDALQPLMKNSRWLRRSRMILRIDNVTDSVQQVRDNNGKTPDAFQRAYLAPRGRYVELSFRKQF